MDYEILYILPPKYSETEIKEVNEKIISLLEKNKVKIKKNQPWGKKKLAYPIKHYHYGYYFFVTFTADPSQIAPLTQQLNIEPEMVRFQIVKEIKGYPEKLSVPHQKEKKEEVEEKGEPEKEETKEPEKEAKQTKEESAEEKEEEKKETPEKKKKTKKVSIDELDKKLDEILKDTI